MEESLHNHEKADGNSQSTKWDTLKDVPFVESRPGHDKDTPRRRSNGERAQRLMELSKTTELRQDEKAFDNRVQELNRDGAYKYLTTLNGILRGVGRSERGVRNNVQVGEHMAPSRKVQGAILNDTTEALKENEKSHQTFNGWTAEDYRTFLKGFQVVQRDSQRVLNDIFKNPENYKRTDGKTWADWLSKTQG